MNYANRTAAVIRSYNNPHVAKQVKNLLDAGIGKVIVVTNAGPDKGSTRGWLATIADPRLLVLEMHEGYTWAGALNRALMAIRLLNLEGGGIEFVLNVSAEALFTKNQILAMLEEFRDNAVGIVGTTFDGRLDGNAVETGRSYRHPRNTGMVVRLDAFRAGFGMFDPRCDEIGGMEDIDFLLATLVLSPFAYRMLDLRIRLILGKNYNQTEKEKREQSAMDKIVARWRDLFPELTPERERIERAITAMQLDP